ACSQARFPMDTSAARMSVLSRRTMNESEMKGAARSFYHLTPALSWEERGQEVSAPSREMTGAPWSRPAFAADLVILVVVAYLPAVCNGFVNYDDDVYVTDNEILRAPEGLRHIWSTIELPQHFPNYPLVFTSFWLEYRLWGLDPRGYHATNIVLH